MTIDSRGQAILEEWEPAYLISLGWSQSEVRLLREGSSILRTRAQDQLGRESAREFRTGWNSRSNWEGK